MYYFRQVQASNDVSLLDHELFSLYVHIVVVGWYIVRAVQEASHC